jgi:hypothetical protein
MHWASACPENTHKGELNDFIKLLDWYAEVAINDVAYLDAVENGDLLAHHPGFNADHFWLGEEFAAHAEKLAAKMEETSNDVIQEVCVCVIVSLQ